MRYGNLEAVIQIDGKALTEYGIVDRGDAVTCWIPSQAGKEFAVHWVDHSTPRLATVGKITVDGRDLTTTSVGYPDHGPFKSSKKGTTKRHNRVNTNEVQPLKFSQIETTDDDEIGIAQESAERLGEIVLRVYDVELTPCKPLPVNPFRAYRAIPQVTKINERSKKAGAHSIQFGETHAKQHCPRVNTTFLSQTPHVTFTFLYRPLEILMAMDIVPSAARTKRRAPSTDSVIEIKDESDDVSTSRSELQALKKLKAQVTKLEAKMKDRSSKRIKRETAPHHAAFTSGEVIDLT